MERTWMPRAAGIMNIIVGSLAMLAGASFIIHVLTFEGTLDWTFAGLVILMSIPLLVFGVLALVGGIYALKREKWGLALTGTIVAFLLLFVFGVVGMVLEIPPYISYLVLLPGIAAIVFTVISRSTFQ
ncbi:hypothetical protein ACFLTN_06495 [Chloroflexota bacterium]